ncbi:hypothetical protein LTR08_009256 [Meristemomyces frigidus]|nr:hypothetical protein LTR08_009256 [Meristemomyces frigidus]
MRIGRSQPLQSRANQLADPNGNELASNPTDEHTYLFSKIGQTSATCSARNGTLPCASGRPGGGSQFAVCEGFLALGSGLRA